MAVADVTNSPNPAPVADKAGETGLAAGNLKEAIFGSFDGMTSTLGVVAGLLATHATAPKIVAAAIGIAVAATVGMGAGQYLSDGARNLLNAVVMPAGTSPKGDFRRCLCGLRPTAFELDGR